MKKLKNKTSFLNKKTILGVLIILILLVGCCFLVNRIQYYRSATDQADITPIRELIILAVRGLKKNAPVDPRTGDVYFPEARLYLPDPSTPLTITYLNDIGDVSNSQSEVSVSTYPIFGTTKLYTAQNIKQLFEAVPKFQACSRGVKLVYKKFPSSDTDNALKHIVHLNNGKTLFVYQEKTCPELSVITDLMPKLRSY